MLLNFSFKDDTTHQEVKDFIDSHEVPLVGHLTTTNKEKRYLKRTPLVMWFFDVDWTFDHRDGRKPTF